MIGNDIVDFSIDEQKYLNPHFIQRILTAKEQSYLSKSTLPNRFLWSLWAAKEAGFKSVQRNNASVTFSPSAYEVTIDTLKALISNKYATHLSAEIKFRQQTLSLKYQWPKDTVVHCVACIDPNNWPYIDSQISHVPNLTSYQKQSQAVRDLAQTVLKKHHVKADIIRPPLSMPGYNKPGPPILVKADNQQPLPHIISLSHDSNYLAVTLYCVPDGLE